MTRSGPTRTTLRRVCLLSAAVLGVAPSLAGAQTTPSDASAAQPKLPSSTLAAPGSPVVERIVQPSRPPLDVRKGVVGAHRRHVAGVRRRRVPRDLERPTLAGVELVAPLPLPGEPPHIVVPLPAYPLDSLAAAFTTPPPPIVCHPVPPDPDAPDPHLYRETTVACMPDNP